jgi:hypothetical protein
LKLQRKPPTRKVIHQKLVGVHLECKLDGLSFARINVRRKGTGTEVIPQRADLKPVSVYHGMDLWVSGGASGQLSGNFWWHDGFTKHRRQDLNALKPHEIEYARCV